MLLTPNCLSDERDLFTRSANKIENCKFISASQTPNPGIYIQRIYSERFIRDCIFRNRIIRVEYRVTNYASIGDEDQYNNLICVLDLLDYYEQSFLDVLHDNNNFIDMQTNDYVTFDRQCLQDDYNNIRLNRISDEKNSHP